MCDANGTSRVVLLFETREIMKTACETLLVTSTQESQILPFLPFLRFLQILQRVSRVKKTFFKFPLGGHRVPLTLRNCRLFSRLALRHRAKESLHAVAALRQGLAAILPLPVILHLMSPAAFEEAVCGVPTVAVAELRRVARHRYPTNIGTFRAIPTATPLVVIRDRVGLL